MDGLRALVLCEQSAQALGQVASESLLLVEDCAQVSELAKVLPSALSMLDAGAEESGTTAECLQGLATALQGLQQALTAIQPHQNNGVTALVMQHSDLWLDVYRAFRGVTAQLSVLTSLVRSASTKHRQASSAADALQAVTHALMATCARARDAAALLGTDLPALASAAAAHPAWCSQRMVAEALQRHAAAAAGHRSTSGSPTHSGLPPKGRASWPVLFRSKTGDFAALAAAAADSKGRHPASGSASPTTVLSPCGSGSGPAGEAALVDTLAGLLDRVADTLLFESELEQLEQDVAYLSERCSVLRSHMASCGQGAASTPAPAPPARGGCGGGGEAAAARASLIQHEVLLAAVQARIAQAEEAGAAASVVTGVAGSAGSCSGSSWVLAPFGRSAACSSRGCSRHGEVDEKRAWCKEAEALRRQYGGDEPLGARGSRGGRGGRLPLMRLFGCFAA